MFPFRPNLWGPLHRAPPHTGSAPVFAVFPPAEVELLSQGVHLHFFSCCCRPCTGVKSFPCIPNRRLHLVSLMAKPTSCPEDSAPSGIFLNTTVSLQPEGIFMYFDHTHFPAMPVSVLGAGLAEGGAMQTQGGDEKMTAPDQEVNRQNLCCHSHLHRRCEAFKCFYLPQGLSD